ncbi:PH domain-containing protein [Evansella halocellulosilytica]|uniref:PH domain-containing protein n=1 Tax=Evansella halocellulosilytica TaxID=2011013 RepID=UPI000BB8A525|nr:PH domain-containing protein [Evansella halocellulosilytica]
MNKWHRQHPTAIFISFLNNLKEMIFTFIAIIIFGQSSQFGSSTFYLFFFTIILVLSLGSGIIRWWTFRYQLFDDEIKIKQGLIFRKKRYIRQDRIQSIDINAKLLQRIFGLVEVKIETAGGGNEPEFRITALKKEEAKEIKDQLLSTDVLNGEEQLVTNIDNLEDQMEAEGEREQHYSKINDDALADFQWNLSNRRLLIAAMTSSGIGIVATFVAAIMSQIQQFIPDLIMDMFIGWVLHSSVLIIGIWLIMILLIAWIITVVRTLLKYGMFSIKKQGNDIHLSRGVIEQRQLTLSDYKITAVRIVQNLIRQPFGYVAVYVESAGGGSKDEDLSTILIPMCKREEVDGLINELLPDYETPNNYEQLPGKSLRRYMVRLLIPAIMVAGFISYFVPYGWISFMLPVFAAGLGYWQYKDAGINATDPFVFIRSRSIVKNEVILPRKRIQSLESSQNYLQSFDQLHSFHVSVLSSITGKTFTLRHISNEQSNKLLEWYSYEEMSE